MKETLPPTSSLAGKPIKIYYRLIQGRLLIVLETENGKHPYVLTNDQWIERKDLTFEAE